MNELKEQVDNQDFTLKLYNICSDLFRNDQIPDVGVEVIKDLIVDDLMQLIETYTAKAIIDELSNYTYCGAESDEIKERINQLSSQLKESL